MGEGVFPPICRCELLSSSTWSCESALTSTVLQHHLVVEWKINITEIKARMEEQDTLVREQQEELEKRAKQIADLKTTVWRVSWCTACALCERVGALVTWDAPLTICPGPKPTIRVHNCLKTSKRPSRC